MDLVQIILIFIAIIAGVLVIRLILVLFITLCWILLAVAIGLLVLIRELFKK